ncbi:GH25 family lysozyme [Tardiphaga sp. 42S5]|uniref:GH25 family lysozyme n=1 Tax=Tardiphaga sp. 42S5 TaxID=1404799 RepID=UPI002A59F73E|nr:GH25 family lysozyme [Tardiphaga sp. 42S5]WPO42027.1 GH25 family lysozyme [Tardiphaga sp. 42S5]
MRSFALLVGVSSYPNFPDPKDRELPPAAEDIALLRTFIDDQKFDEIIVLQNSDATKDNLRYFLEVYLNKQLDLYKMRSRVLFAFSGHGAADDTSQAAAGKLVLGPASGANDFEHVYKLDELAPLLRTVGNKSYHFIALLGSCFSGGIFSAVGSGGDNIFYPRAPGAHAVSATRPDQLAYAFKNEAGSIFFTRLVKGVVTGNADRDYSNWAQDATGSLHLVGGGIVRLGALNAYVSGEIEKLGLMDGTPTPFPQLLSGRLRNDADFGGAFFFLGPDKRNTITVSERTSTGAPKLVSLSISTTAATPSLKNHPEIKIFRAPDTYSIQGVDVSHYNGSIDWKRVSKSRIAFAYMKATEGANFVDETFDRNWKESKQSGIVRGGYHVFNFCKSAKEQFENIKAVIPKDRDALPIAIDVQWVGAPKLVGQARCNDVKAIKDAVADLEKLISLEYGKKPLLHGFSQTFKDIIDDSFLSNSVWLQDYKKTGADGPSLQGKNAWSIWQFSSEAVVPGIKSKVGLNAFYGTKRQFSVFSASGKNVAAPRPVR